MTTPLATAGITSDRDAVTTAYRALSGQFARHVALARPTLPVWLYVSITGVVVYLLLYHLT